MVKTEEPFELNEISADPGTPIDRNLALELVRVTEGAAMSAARFMGRDDKIAADRAAVESMRRSLSHVDMAGVVKIGEGEKDKAPMLYIGEQIGNGNPPLVDVAEMCIRDSHRTVPQTRGSRPHPADHGHR